MKVTITRKRRKTKFGYGWLYYSDAPVKAFPNFNIGGYDSLASLKSYIKRVYKGVEFILTW